MNGYSGVLSDYYYILKYSLKDQKELIINHPSCDYTQVIRMCELIDAIDDYYDKHYLLLPMLICLQIDRAFKESEVDGILFFMEVLVSEGMKGMIKEVEDLLLNLGGGYISRQERYMTL